MRGPALLTQLFVIVLLHPSCGARVLNESVQTIWELPELNSAIIDRRNLEKVVYKDGVISLRLQVVHHFVPHVKDITCPGASKWDAYLQSKFQEFVQKIEDVVGTETPEVTNPVGSPLDLHAMKFSDDQPRKSGVGRIITENRTISAPRETTVTIYPTVSYDYE